MPAFLYAIRRAPATELAGLDAEEALELLPGMSIEIGRATHSHISIRGIGMGPNRRSCRILDEDGQWNLMHLGDSGAVSVNGYPLQKKSALSCGDVIVVHAEGGQ